MDISSLLEDLDGLHPGGSDGDGDGGSAEAAPAPTPAPAPAPAPVAAAPRVGGEESPAAALDEQPTVEPGAGSSAETEESSGGGGVSDLLAQFDQFDEPPVAATGAAAEEAVPPENPAGAAAGATSSGDGAPPQLSKWVRYWNSSAEEERGYYRHKVSEELTLRAPEGDGVVEEREEKDAECFAMMWQRAGGKGPAKQSWGSWLKAGVTKTTAAIAAATAVDPEMAAHVQNTPSKYGRAPAGAGTPSGASGGSQRGSGSSQRSSGGGSGSGGEGEAEAEAEWAAATSALRMKLKGDVSALGLFEQLEGAWRQRERAFEEERGAMRGRAEELERAMADAAARRSKQDALTDQLLAAAAVDKQRLAELERAGGGGSG